MQRFPSTRTYPSDPVFLLILNTSLISFCALYGRLVHYPWLLGSKSIWVRITIKISQFWTLRIVLLGFSEIEFCLRLQVAPTEWDPTICTDSLCLRTPAATPIWCIKLTQHTPFGVVASVTMLCCSLHWVELSRFHLKKETESSLWNFMFQRKGRDG
jgi:hypothetical protein